MVGLEVDPTQAMSKASLGDIRRICDLFGLSITGATRYLKTVEHPDNHTHRLRSPDAAWRRRTVA